MNSDLPKRMKANRSSMADAYDELAKVFPDCREEIVTIVDEYLDTPAAYLKIKELVLLKLGGGAII